jgi:hypothetical protein
MTQKEKRKFMIEEARKFEDGEFDMFKIRIVVGTPEFPYHFSERTYFKCWLIAHPEEEETMRDHLRKHRNFSRKYHTARFRKNNSFTVGHVEEDTEYEIEEIFRI